MSKPNDFETEVILILKSSLNILEGIIKKADYHAESLDNINKNYLSALIHTLNSFLDYKKPAVIYTDLLCDLAEITDKVAKLSHSLSEHLKLDAQITGMLYTNKTTKC